MVQQIKSLDISEEPELLRLAEEVRTTNQPCILTRDDEMVAVLMSPATRRARASRKRTYLTAADPFWDIVGMSEAKEGPTDVAEHKYHYLAEAYGTRSGGTLPRRHTRRRRYHDRAGDGGG